MFGKCGKTEKEKAVSPVVGVMLMLVVTIVLAAVVSSFSGGMATETDKAPQAALEVHFYKNGLEGYAMTMEHLSGDYIPTKDVQLILYYKDQKVTISPSTSNAPYLNDVSRAGYFSDSRSHFGNYTLIPGDIAVIPLDKTASFSDNDIKDFLDWDNVTQYDTIEVKILHTPSQKFIYDREVVIE